MTTEDRKEYQPKEFRTGTHDGKPLLNERASTPADAAISTFKEKLREELAEDSTENMPEIFYIRDDSNGGYEFTDDGDPIGFSYYSQADLDRSVADVKENLTIEDIKAWADGIHACPDELKDRVTEEEANLAHLILNPGAVADAKRKTALQCAEIYQKHTHDGEHAVPWIADAIIKVGSKSDG